MGSRSYTPVIVGSHSLMTALQARLEVHCMAGRTFLFHDSRVEGELQCQEINTYVADKLGWKAPIMVSLNAQHNWVHVCLCSTACRHKPRRAGLSFHALTIFLHFPIVHFLQAGHLLAHQRMRVEWPKWLFLISIASTPNFTEACWAHQSCHRWNSIAERRKEHPFASLPNAKLLAVENHNVQPS